MPNNVQEEWENKVRAEANRLWEEAGKPENVGDRFWFLAEKQLQARFDGLCGCLKHPIKLGHPDVVKWRNWWWFVGCLSEAYQNGSA